MRCLMVGSSLIALLVDNAAALNIVLPGGTGSIGSRLSAKLMDHTVTILTRNAFLAAAPNRVTEQFGWVGSSFLRKNPHVNLRDWDGGDLLDIVGQDWIGWQEEALLDADVVVHFVGGFTEQRTMACERLVRESMRVNKDALQITVNPLDEEIGVISVGAVTQKKERIRACEEMVKMNCVHSMCLRIECYREDEGCEKIKSTIVDWAKHQGNK